MDFNSGVRWSQARRFVRYHATDPDFSGKNHPHRGIPAWRQALRDKYTIETIFFGMYLRTHAAAMNTRGKTRRPRTPARYERAADSSASSSSENARSDFFPFFS